MSIATPQVPTAAELTAAHLPNSPGAQFARAYLRDREHAAVEFDFTITDAFQPTKERPRVTVRNLLKTRRVALDEVTVWSESRPTTTERGAAVHEAELRREAAFRFGAARFGVHPIRGWVRVPDALLDQPELLAEFIDYRLLVRLATAENQELLIGAHGMLRHPELTRLEYQDSYIKGLLTACDEIEQTGATAHAMIVNPRDYYHELVGAGSLLSDLARNGTLISRTRMVAPGSALIGDFAMAVRLLEAGRSVIKVAEPPAGTFAEPGPAVCAEVYEGVALHLPTHLFHVVPAA
jgi:hypothetical protein